MRRGAWGAGGGAVCRRGVRRGAVSRPFGAADLLRALAAPARARTVYVDVDGAGFLVAGAGCGGAELCARAALAPNVSARNALLTAAAGAREPRLQLRLEAPLPPHAALRVWLAEPLRAALGVPHLAPRNIRGGEEYACDRCGARFTEPNPLKVHLFLGCAEPEPHEFWRALAGRLSAIADPTSLETFTERLSAPADPTSPGAFTERLLASTNLSSPGVFTELLSTSADRTSPDTFSERLPTPADPARLEALAAAWGGGEHACVYCGKRYSRKYGLKIHIRTHTGYRPLRCRHCARAFGDPSNLNKHVRLHEGPRRPRPRPPRPPRRASFISIHPTLEC